jgi:predicted hydrocarbon binding protein
MIGAPQKIKFVACILSQYLVKNSLEYAPLEVKYAVNVNNCIKVGLSRSNKKEARRSLFTFFGGMDEIIKITRSRLPFWKDVISRHVLSNYNMVTVHTNYLEDLFADKIPAGEIMIENLSKKPIQEIPLKEMLPLIKEVYETSRIADRVDIDKDTVIVSHSYRTKEAVEKLKKSLVALLEANGHLYDAKSAANMIVLAHRKDVGIKINEIVDVLKTSNSTLDQVLLMFMAFLEGLKDMPDIPISLTALGRRIGRSLMHEYEKENGIKEWSPKNFQNALEIIDSRLHRVSEWKLEGKNLLYTVRKCHIAAEGNTFDTYICHTAREMFKGALEYAFGNKAELDIKKLLSHGDNFCEVMIRIP